MKKNILIVLLSCSLFGCFTQIKPLSEKGQKVQISTSSSVAHDCTYVGDVSGTAKGSSITDAQLNARNDLRNNAASIGANVVQLDTNTGAFASDYSGRYEIVLTGSAYFCKK